MGEPARCQAVTNEERTFFSFKRDIGKGNSYIIDGKEYSHQQIYAMLLKELKEDAENYLGECVTEAVIAVPVKFDSLQCQEVKEAAMLAGLEVKRVISEPGAAALAYGFGLSGEKDEKIMICDFGGGNFSVAIVEIGDNVVEVIAVNGEIDIGGDNFDERIVQWMLDELKRVEGVNLSSDKVAMQMLKEAAENAKIELSDTRVANISLPFIADTGTGYKNFDRDLTREKFEELTNDLVEKMAISVKNVIKDAGDIDLRQVYMIGGSSFIPVVQETVRSITGIEPSKFLKYSECVAIGASIQGGKLTGSIGSGDILLLDVVPLSLAIETNGGVATRVIERNTTIPTKGSMIFSTAEDNQTAVDIIVVEGEERLSRDNKFLGHFRLNGIIPAKKGVPQIEVTVDVGGKGNIYLCAKDLGTGKCSGETFPISKHSQEESCILGGINKMLPSVMVESKDLTGGKWWQKVVAESGGMARWK